MMDWLIFASMFAAFFVSHAVPVRPAIKAKITTKIGASAFTFAYSMLSLIMMGLLIWAAGRAPLVLVWPPSVWHKYLLLGGMFGVCLLLALTIGRPNPFSFGGARNEKFDPMHPGIVRWIRHPVLTALALWAALHVLANGDLAHIILFGAFAGFAVLGKKIIDRRKQRQMGARWDALWTQTGIAQPSIRHISPRRIAAAFVLYALLLWLHPMLFGVSPLP